MLARDLKTRIAALFTLSIVLVAVAWSLQERNQVAFALRRASSESGAPYEPRRTTLRRRREKLPNSVRLAVDPALAASSANYRSSVGHTPLPDWAASHYGYSASQCTRLDVALTENGRTILDVVLGPWWQGESFRFELPPEPAAGCAVTVSAAWYSDLGPAIEEGTGQPVSEWDYELTGIEGVLTLASAQFAPGARVPFHLDLRCRENDTAWEARGVFVFP